MDFKYTGTSGEDGSSSLRFTSIFATRIQSVLQRAKYPNGEICCLTIWNYNHNY